MKCSWFWRCDLLQTPHAAAIKLHSHDLLWFNLRMRTSPTNYFLQWHHLKLWLFKHSSLDWASRCEWLAISEAKVLSHEKSECIICGKKGCCVKIEPPVWSACEQRSSSEVFIAIGLSGSEGGGWLKNLRSLRRNLWIHVETTLIAPQLNVYQ